MNTNPIGIFDSGVGGTSIWKEIHTLLPFESTLYLADSKNAPYGQKSKEAIVELSFKNAEKLLAFGAKIIVVACNTATTNAIQQLRQHYTIPIIGIEPAIKPAALQTKTNTIGILATKGTLQSSLFSKTSERYAQNSNIIEIVGEGLVQQVEQNNIDTPETIDLLETYLAPLLKANIDCLVLGCTHYPYLIPQIKKILPSHIKIIDSGEAVAKQIVQVLEKNNLQSKSAKPTHTFYSNSSLNTLESLLHEYKKEITISQLAF